MPKYYCEYCDIYLTHSSPVGRRQHIHGRKHISAKIEYFQNLLREEGITPQTFLGFLNNRNGANSLGSSMMNYMHNNMNMYMKYNQIKTYQNPIRNSNTYRLNMPNNKYSRAGYAPPCAPKYIPNQTANMAYPNNNKYSNNTYSNPNMINIANKNNNFAHNNQQNNNINTNDTIKNKFSNTHTNVNAFNDNINNTYATNNENSLSNTYNNANNTNNNFNNQHLI